METKLYKINVTLSREQKENIFDAFINNGKLCIDLKINALTGSDTLLVPERLLKVDIDNKLDEETFSEMNKNGFYLIPLKNDGGLEKYEVSIPKTVVERLEMARRREYKLNEILFDNIVMVILLDYSLINKSTKSTKYSIFKNISELIENII